MSKNSGRYSDIIDLPHHQSIYRPHMTIYNRAAQFAPFAALVGYDEMVQDTADFLLLDKRIILSEDVKNVLDRKMQIIWEDISLNPEIEIIYFNEQADGQSGKYVRYSGKVKRILEYSKELLFLDGTVVKIDDIVHMSGEVLSKYDI